MNTVTVIFKHSDNKFDYPCKDYSEALDFYIEKCKELNIEVFFCFVGKNQINSLTKLLETLDKLEKKLAI